MRNIADDSYKVLCEWRFSVGILYYKKLVNTKSSKWKNAIFWRITEKKFRKKYFGGNRKL